MCMCFMHSPFYVYAYQFMQIVFILIPIRLLVAHVQRARPSTWLFYTCFSPAMLVFRITILPLCYDRLVPLFFPDLVQFAHGF